MWGLYNYVSLTRVHYFLTFIDDFSISSWIYMLPNKGVVAYVVTNFVCMIKNQFHLKVQKVRTNNGGEFLSYYLTKFLSNEGIFHHKPVPILLSKMELSKENTNISRK